MFLVSFRAILRELVEIRLMHVHRRGNWLDRQSIVDCLLVWCVCSYDLEPKRMNYPVASLAREFLCKNFISRQGNCCGTISTGIREEVKDCPFICGLGQVQAIG